LSLSGSAAGSAASASSFKKPNKLSLDASLSNSIYGASNTVQPYALTVRYIIKAYDGVTPTPSQADISQILTELTGKANINGSNMTYHKDVITTSGTYTAPATGLYKITVKGGGGAGGIPTDGYYSGGGGGEGGTTLAYANLTAGDSVTVSVGAGGTGAGTPSDGGDSSVTINGTTYTAGGGKKGNDMCSGGEGGTGTIPGAPGGTGNRVLSTTADITTGGSGGGAGGGIGSFGAAPTSGVLGGGGAGMGRGAVASESSAGGDGYVWFEYYTP
jgi:hypothetical protein